MTAALTAVTLVRLAADGNATTYAAVHSADALAMVAEWMVGHGAGSADTLPWETLPGVQSLAAFDLQHRPRRSVCLIGTAVEGHWTSWHVPAEGPAVPA